MGSAYLAKANVEKLLRKEQIRKDEKTILGTYEQREPLQLIERCARDGDWVFI